jgi:hypothetical protein
MSNRDSSKDLEKDEREWRPDDYGRRSGVTGGWLQVVKGSGLIREDESVVSKARLQQVEAERDEAKARYGELHDRIIQAAPVCSTANSALSGLAYVAREYPKVQAELSIAREALKEIRKPSKFYSGAEAERLRRVAEVALARSQAKENGT